MLAPAKMAGGSVVENAKTAALHKKHNFSAAESERRVGGENRIGKQARGVVRWKDSVFGEDHSAPRIGAVAHRKIRIDMVGGGEERTIRRKGGRHHFVRANRRADQASVDAADEPGRV